MQEQMAAIGYVLSPNNIHSLSGVIMYAGGPNVLEPKHKHQVQVLNDRIRIFETRLFGEPYTKQTYQDTVTIAVFTNTDDFKSWCRENGQISEGGIYQPFWID